jgi:hypothetical protein
MQANFLKSEERVFSPTNPPEFESVFDRLLHRPSYDTALKLYTSEAQIKLYGETEWRNNFVFLDDLRVTCYRESLSKRLSENDARKGAEEFKASVWRQYSQLDPFGAMVQSVFTSPRHYAVPGEVRKSRVGQHYFVHKSKADINGLGCSWCILDVDRIRPKFLADLGLVTWVPGQGNSYLNVLERMADPIVLSKVKLILDSVERVSKGVWITRKPSQIAYQASLDKLNAYQDSIAESNDNNRKIDPEQLTLSPKAIGVVLKLTEKMSGAKLESEKQRQQFTPVRSQISIYPDIYRAIRASQHAHVGYNTELVTLTDILLDLDSLQRRIHKDWRSGSYNHIKDGIREDFKRVCQYAANKLNSAQNIQKVEVRGKLNAALERIERDGFMNPMAEKQRLAAEATLIRTRIQDALKKKGRQSVGGDELSQRVSYAEGVIAAFRSDVTSKAIEFEGFVESSTALGQRPWPQGRVDERLNLVPPLFDVNELKARPFLTWRNKILAISRDLKRSIQSGQLESVRLCYAELDLACAIVQVNTCFAQLKSKVIASSPVAIDVITPYADKLKTVLLSDQLYEKELYERVLSSYSRLVTAIDEIVHALEIKKGGDFDETKRREIYENMGTHLDRFDLIGLLER